MPVLEVPCPGSGFKRQKHFSWLRMQQCRVRQLPKRVEFVVQVSYRDFSPKFKVLVWGASNRHQNAIGNYSSPYSAACEGFHCAGLLAVPWTPSRWSLHQKQ